MKAYWDSSALMQSLAEPALQVRLKRERGFTRPHTLAEVFSALTGNPVIRVDADDASEFISALARNLDFVELGVPEILQALRTARQKGVRGGRVHDYLHAVAAEKSGAAKILTLDRNDFSGISGLPVEQA
jgi:predicted nucleic acid-binding protein